MKRIPSPQTAFSLLEILVVIAILSILALLGLGVMNRAGETANKSRCINNLRQIGIAVHEYAQEHNNLMPGPTLGALRCYTAPYYITPNASETSNLTRQMSLVDRLAPYLGMTTRPGSAYTPREVCSQFVCPSGRKFVERAGIKYDDGTYYNSSLDPRKPLGYWGSATSFYLPPRRAQLEEWGSILLIIDNDNDLRPSGSAPSRPSHGAQRHALYMDGHVAGVKLTEVQ